MSSEDATPDDPNWTKKAWADLLDEMNPVNVERRRREMEQAARELGEKWARERDERIWAAITEQTR